MEKEKIIAFIREKIPNLWGIYLFGSQNTGINNAENIKKCLNRIEKQIKKSGTNFKEDIDAQDIIVLNLQRACQRTIDMGARFIKLKNLGIPQSAGNVFEILKNNEIISAEMEGKMLSMVGFRNIAIHDYSKVNIKIIEAILEKHLNDFSLFAKLLMGQY